MALRFVSLSPFLSPGTAHFLLDLNLSRNWDTAETLSEELLFVCPAQIEFVSRLFVRVRLLSLLETLNFGFVNARVCLSHLSGKAMDENFTRELRMDFHVGRPEIRERVIRYR